LVLWEVKIKTFINNMYFLIYTIYYLNKCISMYTYYVLYVRSTLLLFFPMKPTTLNKYTKHTHTNYFTCYTYFFTHFMRKVVCEYASVNYKLVLPSSLSRSWILKSLGHISPLLHEAGISKIAIHAATGKNC